jgi:glycine oxidase
MAEHGDVLVLGGGVIGLSTAWFLAQAGVRVTIVDQGDLGRQASWAGAGIISPGNLEHAHTAMDQLRAHSADLFPRLSGSLWEHTGIDNGYCRCGGLDLIANADDDMADAWRREGIVVEELAGDELHRQFPCLASSLTRAYFLPDMAQVRNPRHLQALQAACATLGVQMRPHCPARRLVRHGSRIEAVETDRDRLSADRYLIATGAWTDALLEPLGVRPGIQPVRGQIALLNTGVAERRPVLHRGKCYLVPRGDGRVLIGSTEEDAGFHAHTTAAAIAGLLSFGTSLVPELGQAAVERCWAGLRPGSPDGKPFLGPVPGFDNFFLAAGHFRSGIQLSPATALVMKEVLLGEKPTIALDDFRLDRPPGSPARPAFRS